MKHSRPLALLPFLAFILCAPLTPARAQEIDTPVIVIKRTAPSQQKPLKTHFEVVRMSSTSIQVRSLVNNAELHTFTFSDAILGKMQQLFDAGGYQYGDKVAIWYMPGTEVALRIKGKPSKPL
ncbi:MAG: hypothetical protein ACRD4Y_04175 [Candidatus Acidiferrales bacterium]